MPILAIIGAVLADGNENPMQMVGLHKVGIGPNTLVRLEVRLDGGDHFTGRRTMHDVVFDASEQGELILDAEGTDVLARR